MALDDFIRQWEELEDVSRSVSSMSNARDNPSFFGDSYTQFRNQVGAPWTSHPFSVYAEFNDETIGNILMHAGAFRQGLENHVLTSTRNDFPNILDGIRTKLGDDNLVDYVASMEVRADDPANFVRKLKNYRELLKPLSRDNPQTGVIKTKLVDKIDNVVGPNPDAKTRTIVEALKGLYDSERAAVAAYAQIFVKPERDIVKQAINANDNWKDYMTANLDKYTKEERLAIYSDMHKRFK